ncbi:All-trans-retinol 13,14-reductase [Hondaea fermentalgiana]|uniref:All-trans-retinol 13,14-reductase n=1 Tax=Hondaea fermentalgiana TaxID=2315210 RepID=A0A2R5GQC1_9STRA|nr:All-trans-retinol 13,14-reductase [Hondaea fermentalgiana]|eukprot:GBG33050.1 All-trans-retinol 13,14-reductase [Hondaea fermentalgiana]
MYQQLTGASASASAMLPFLHDGRLSCDHLSASPAKLLLLRRPLLLPEKIDIIITIITITITFFARDVADADVDADADDADDADADAQRLIQRAGVVPVVGTVVSLLSLVSAAGLLIVAALAFSPLALQFRELPQGKARRGLLHERYSKSKAVEDGPWDAIIIGSGMGGLTCGSTLSRFGKRVLVLEQHDMAGGGTHTFVLQGKTDYNFDSGLHYTVPESAELIQLACGTRNKPIEFDKLGEEDDCFDKVVLGDIKQDGFRVRYGEKHLDTLRKMFPDAKDQREMDEFLALANRVNNLFPVWLLSKALPKWARHQWKQLFLKTFTAYASRTGEDVTKEIVSNPKLAALLNGLWMDAGSPPDESTFMMSAALSVGFPQRGGAYPTGGSELMATKLIQGIEASGGRVLMRARVQEIMLENGRAVGVRIDNGDEVRAPLVISACGYGNTYSRLLPKDAIPEGYMRKVKGPDGKEQLALPETLTNSSSWVMANLGIRVDPKEVGIGCSNVWVHPCSEENNYDLFQGVREYFAKPLDVPTIPMMITFPSVKDRACKAGEKQRLTCQLLALAHSEWFDKWEAEEGKHPAGGEYETLKQKWMDRLLELFLQRYPMLKDKIELSDLSTPLSIKYFLNKPGGGAVGLDVTPPRFSDTHTEDLLDMKSPIDGLWLTGEDTLLCGQPLAQLSGILTTFRIVGLSGSLQFVLWVIKLAISDLLL